MWWQRNLGQLLSFQELGNHFLQSNSSAEPFQLWLVLRQCDFLSYLDCMDFAVESEVSRLTRKHVTSFNLHLATAALLRANPKKSSCKYLISSCSISNPLSVSFSLSFPISVYFFKTIF